MRVLLRLHHLLSHMHPTLFYYISLWPWKNKSRNCNGRTRSKYHCSHSRSINEADYKTTDKLGRIYKMMLARSWRFPERYPIRVRVSSFWKPTWAIDMTHIPTLSPIPFLTFVTSSSKRVLSFIRFQLSIWKQTVYKEDSCRNWDAVFPKVDGLEPDDLAQIGLSSKYKRSQVLAKSGQSHC